MNNVLKLIGKHFLSALIAISFCFVGLFGILNCNIGEFRLSSTIGYFGVFAVLPICVFLLCLKKRIFRWYIGAMLPILLLISGLNFYLDSFVISEDLSNYLKDDSQFNYFASMYLPEEKDLKSAEKTEYIHKRWYYGQQYIYLSARYDASTYDAIIDKLDRTRSVAISTHAGAPYYFNREDPFVWNGHLYRSFLISYDGDYFAFVFCYCDDSSSIEMMFIEDPCLSSMSIEDVIKFSPYEKYK